MYLHVALYAIVLSLTIWGRHLSYSLRSGIITCVTLVLGVGLLVGGGFASFGLLSLFCFCILSTILFNTRAGIISCVVCLGLSRHRHFSRFRNPGIRAQHLSRIEYTVSMDYRHIRNDAVCWYHCRNTRSAKHTGGGPGAYPAGKKPVIGNEIAERNRMEKERTVLEGKLQLAKKMEAVECLPAAWPTI